MNKTDKILCEYISRVIRKYIVNMYSEVNFRVVLLSWQALSGSVFVDIFVKSGFSVEEVVRDFVKVISDKRFIECLEEQAKTAKEEYERSKQDEED